MCCLFGLVDYGHTLTTRQKNRILKILSIACEARGTDATGIAYNSCGKLRIYKRPLPAHQLHIRIPEDVWTIMGHTRMTTQGSQLYNRNNHPFSGHTKDGDFALAHNGVLYNDKYLRQSLGLPKTKIETDSYIAVQMIEKKETLNFSSLRYMAEHVEGSFSFTILDSQDRLYLVKGNNPLCMYYFPTLGVYCYASTEEILKKAMDRLWLPARQARRIEMDCGDILRIDRKGILTRSRFDASHLFREYFDPFWQDPCCREKKVSNPAGNPYLEEIKSVASAFGYAPETIDRLAALGFSAEELEEYLYCGEG